MKTIIMQASPRKEGNTATLAKEFMKGASSEQNDITYFTLNDMNIKPCQTCFKCMGGDCVQQDDMQEIYREFNQSDLFVFATPIYWWNMSAQMKLCIDRMTALLKTNDTIPALRNKTVVLIITYKYRSCAEATINMFKDFIDWAHVDLHILEYCSLERHVKASPDKLEEARTLGRLLQKPQQV